MPYKDPEKARANARERKRRYLERKKIAKYGESAAGLDMRGRHGNHAKGAANARMKPNACAPPSPPWRPTMADYTKPESWVPEDAPASYVIAGIALLPEVLAAVAAAPHERGCTSHRVCGKYLCAAHPGSIIHDGGHLAFRHRFTPGPCDCWKRAILDAAREVE